MQIETFDFSDLSEGCADRLELSERLLKRIQPETFAEIGVWKGEFAERALQTCESIRRYYMVDPWATLPDWNKPYNVAEAIFDDVYEEALSRTKFASQKIAVLRGRTKDVIDRIRDESLDAVYIDGDHTLRGITIDLLRLYPKVKRNGYILGDDFTATPWQHDSRYEPTMVCPFSIYFAEAMDIPIVALPFNQFVMQKRDDLSFYFRDIPGLYSDISLNKFPSGFASSSPLMKLWKRISSMRRGK